MIEHTAAGANVLITATTASDDLAATARTVRQELAWLCQHGVDGQELCSAQRFLLGSLLRSASGARRLCAFVATWLARAGVPPRQLLASAAMIRDVTSQGVVRAARHTLAPSVMSLAVCGAWPNDLPIALTDESGD
jgi:predicted Zn-dependent peptidase